MKKLLTILLLSIFIFSCGGKKNDTLVLGTCAIFAPFTYMENGQHVGFDIEVAKVIAANYGKKLEIVNMNFDQLIPAVQNGDIDMAMSSMTITHARGRIIDFSNPYYEASQGVLVRTEDLDSYANITTKEQLGREKMLAAERDSTGAAAAKAIAGANPVFEDSYDLVVAELVNGKIDAVIMDKIISMGSATSHQTLSVVPAIRFDPEYYGIAVKKGNRDLMASINQTINELVVSGDYHRLEQTHVNAYFE